MVFGITAKTGSRLFTRFDLNKQHYSFSAAVLMSIVGLGVSLFSTNKLLVASSSTRSILTKSK